MATFNERAYFSRAGAKAELPPTPSSYNPDSLNRVADKWRRQKRRERIVRMGQKLAVMAILLALVALGIEIWSFYNGQQ